MSILITPVKLVPLEFINRVDYIAIETPTILSANHDGYFVVYDHEIEDTTEEGEKIRMKLIDMNKLGDFTVFKSTKREKLYLGEYSKLIEFFDDLNAGDCIDIEITMVGDKSIALFSFDSSEAGKLIARA